MKKKWICLLTALTLIVGICAAEPMISGAVALDLEKKCTMTIYPEDPDKSAELSFGKDLADSKIKVDVYKIASAEKVSGTDTYSYEFESIYSEAAAPFLEKLRAQQNDTPQKPNEGALRASDWEKLAQDVGKIAFETNEKGELVHQLAKADTVDIKSDATKKTKELEPGLYLLIARGSDMASPSDYIVTMQCAKDATDKSVNGNIASIANSDKYTYIFSPQLISVPMRGGDGALNVTGPAPETENGPMPGMIEGNMTSDGDRWVYDVNVYLKPLRTLRYGALKITKNLEIYESEETVEVGEGDTVVEWPEGKDEKVTFVFRASWQDPFDSKKTDSKVDSITFDVNSGRSEERIISRIPVGTKVTVEEIYYGASYSIVGSAKQTATVEGEKIKNGIVILDKDNAVKTIISAPLEEGETPEEPVIGTEASIAFTNTYNGRQRKGYGINNKFTYDDNGDWIWTSDPKMEGSGTKVHNPNHPSADLGTDNQ